MKIGRILCPTDFSDCSHRALGHAVMVARSHGAMLTLLHVYPLFDCGDGLYLPSSLSVDGTTRARLARNLAAAVEPAQAAGVDAEVCLFEGEPVDEILRRAQGLAADLIVMGTHGRQGLDRWLLGSVAERVIQRASCAVLTVPPEPSGAGGGAVSAYREILCPLDLADSATTLDAALAMARASGAGLLLLHVLDDLARQEETARAAHLTWPDLFDRFTSAARQRLRQAAEAQDATGVTMDEIALAGKPYREILRLAHDRRVSLIVMGIHGLNPLARMFVGSTTLQVLRHAHCPVLTVRPPEATS